MVVRWRTGLATDSRVRFGPSPSQLDTSVTLPGGRREHVVELTGLVIRASMPGLRAARSRQAPT